MRRGMRRPVVRAIILMPFIVNLSLVSVYDFWRLFKNEKLMRLIRSFRRNIFLTLWASDTISEVIIKDIEISLRNMFTNKNFFPSFRNKARRNIQISDKF